jgi:ssDNA-binding replication factor A large subunit
MKALKLSRKIEEKDLKVKNILLNALLCTCLLRKAILILSCNSSLSLSSRFYFPTTDLEIQPISLAEENSRKNPIVMMSNTDYF